MTVTIYTLDCPNTGQVRYVGKTINLRKRFNCHLCHDKSNEGRTEWIKSLKANGQKPAIGVLEVIENSNGYDWQDAERFWIDTLRFYGCNLLNQMSGGWSGRTPLPSTRLKMSLARKGKPFSESHRAKLASFNRARVYTPEMLAKLSMQRKGKPHSDEAKLKMSTAKIGKKLSEEHKRKLSLTNKMLGIIPPSPKGRKHTPETLEKMRAFALTRKRDSSNKFTL